MHLNNRRSLTNYAWTILIIAYLVAFSGALAMTRISPLVPVLLDTFRVNLFQVSSLVSIFGVTGILISLPSGILLKRIGMKLAGLIALGLIIAGALVATIGGSFTFLLIGRVLEGVGVALITVLAPALLTAWFPPEKIGLAIGIWNTSTPVASFCTMTFASVLEQAVGWKGVWTVIAGLAMLALLAYYFFYRDPPLAAADERDSGKIELRAILTNHRLILLGVAIVLYTMTFMSFITFLPTYLNREMGLPLQRAGAIAGLAGLISFVGSPLAGWISDRMGARKPVILFGYLLIIPLIGSIYRVPLAWVIPYMVLFAISSCAVPTLAFIAAPELLEGKGQAPLALAIVSASLSLGMVIGPPITGAIIENFGWVTSGYVMVLLATVGVGTILANRKFS